jgi:hypothetical protein
MQAGEDMRQHVHHVAKAFPKGIGRVWRKLLWADHTGDGSAPHWAVEDEPTKLYSYADQRQRYAAELATLRQWLAQHHGIHGPEHAR